MSDEEKEAIEYFNTETTTEAMHYGAVLVKIIEKQFKEIEELKAHQIIFTNDYKPIGSKGRKFISENKIKAEIEELKLECENCPYQGELCDELKSNNNCVPGMSILILQSLLEKE